MNPKKLGLVTLIIAVVLVGLFYALKSNKHSSQDASTQNKSTVRATTKKYTKEEVATHKTSGDCWTIINGKVYDITTYVSQHPGGAEILRACGIDATTLFTTRTTQDGQKVGSGTPHRHSSSAQAQLDALLIGSL